MGPGPHRKADAPLLRPSATLSTRCLLVAFVILMLAFQSTLMSYQMRRQSVEVEGGSGTASDSSIAGGGGLNPVSVLRRTRDTLTGLATAAGSWQTRPHHDAAAAGGSAAAAVPSGMDNVIGGAGGGGAAEPAAAAAGCGEGGAAGGQAPPPQWTTQQHCHMAQDESEICVYDNALCFDGEKIIVFVPAAELRTQKDHRTW
jgi:hypothetical protein